MKALLLILFMCTACSSNPRYDKSKAHHTPTGFQNVHAYESHGFWAFWKWRWQAMFKDIPEPEDYNFKLKNAYADISAMKYNRKDTTVSWIGHATFLIQHQGLNILTDPQFSDRASPVQWAGPRRVIPPAIMLSELPNIDVVIISHDHYDSLDLYSVKQLAERMDHTLEFVVPLGFKKWFRDNEIHNRIIELDWHEIYTRNARGSLPVEFIATPVQHWGKRTLFDAYSRLWASFVIRSDKANFFFGGDTGYCPHFKEIGEKYGPFDISLLPIGAYEPRWFMKAYHVTPKQSVQIHQDLKSKQSIGMHWGTFILTDEPLDQPPRDLQKALEEANMTSEEFQVWQHGESRLYENL